MPRLRATIGYAALSAVGLIILLRLIPAERGAGVCLLAIGGAGLAGQARRAWRAAQAEQRRKQQAAARAALIQARRERTERERHARRERRQTEERARTRQADALRAQREQATAARQRLAERHTARQEQLETAAERWRALNGAELMNEIARLFLRRGFEIERSDDRPAELLLVDAAGRHTMACCLDHAAQAADVQALDLRRRDLERRHAYLIALEGFSPQAVRLVRGLPITLVEAHLLAAWEGAESTD